jgi:hypothetical protein
MRSGQMFGGLSDYSDEDFFRQHSDVCVYLPGRSLQYAVYSAYACTVDDPACVPGQTDEEEEFMELVEHTKANSVWESGLFPESSDQILTLLTCADGGDAKMRYVVNCVVAEVSDNQK